MSRDKTEVMATEMEMTMSPSRISEQKKEATIGVTNIAVVESYEKKKKKYEDMAAEDKNRYEKEIEESGAKPTKAMKL